VNAGRNEGACGALERKQERREQWALSVEVKNSPLPPLGFIDPWEPRSPNRVLRIAASVTDERGPPQPERPHARTHVIITVQQPKSCGGLSRPPTNVARYAHGRDA
jgi:hypothetical protein